MTDLSHTSCGGDYTEVQVTEGQRGILPCKNEKWMTLQVKVSKNVMTLCIAFYLV